MNRSAVYDVLTHGVPVNVDVPPADHVTSYEETGDAGRTMHAVDTLVVGAGQAGLAVSRSLTGQGADHVVVERGRIAERWRSARWDSLRLLTPNWMSRLPGWSYPGPTQAATWPHRSWSATWRTTPPVRGPGTRERDGRARRGGRRRPARDHRPANLARAQRDRGDRDREPGRRAAGRQRDRPGDPPADRRPLPGPGQVPGGGVLVVGASASGVQIADELRRAGRPVVISVGRHARLPRRYRDRDILWWMERAGVLDQAIDQVHDARMARRAPSLQLSGRADHPVGLDALAARGVRLAGRLVAADGLPAPLRR